MESKVILLTGASSGIGFQTAEYLAKQGHKVYGAARRVEQIEALKPLGVVPLMLDLTQEASIAEAVAHVIDLEKRIDVLVNNAGYGLLGAVEDVELSEVRKQFEVNVFGLASITKAVLPYMRAQKQGTIINISSIAGRISMPFWAWYTATKHSIEAFSDALRMEVASKGIHVVVIEPGGIKTNWGLIAAEHLENNATNSAYKQQALSAAQRLKQRYEGASLSEPIVIAKAIAHAVNSKRPKSRYLIGFGAKPLAWLHTLLPTRLFDFIAKRL
ncbi:oxidoreductase [Hoylesella nanceiensis]|uniref:oxidoreductase n=1 Tax=Hoylesella nanceiensis TaxID=425941 RepID=UPI0028E2FD52|nr:oxidoreductase [Hoylesella nanceiensis]